MTDYTGIDNLEVMREAKNYNAYLHSIIDAQIRPQDKVVDFGAGSGTFAIPLVRRGVDIVCVEQDPQLKEILREADTPVVSSLDEISMASVDFVYSLNVLEHIDDHREALSALAERLKNGGRLLLYVPAFPILFSAMDRKVGHHRRYRRGQLMSLLDEAGFRVRDAIYVDSLGFVLTIAYRIAGSDTGDINRTALKIYDRFFFKFSRLLDRGLQHWIGKNLLVLAEKARETFAISEQ